MGTPAEERPELNMDAGAKMRFFVNNLASTRPEADSANVFIPLDLNSTAIQAAIEGLYDAGLIWRLGDLGRFLPANFLYGTRPWPGVMSMSARPRVGGMLVKEDTFYRAVLPGLADESCVSMNKIGMHSLSPRQRVLSAAVFADQSGPVTDLGIRLNYSGDLYPNAVVFYTQILTATTGLLRDATIHLRATCEVIFFEGDEDDVVDERPIFDDQQVFDAYQNPAQWMMDFVQHELGIRVS